MCAINYFTFLNLGQTEKQLVKWGDEKSAAIEISFLIN